MANESIHQAVLAVLAALDVQIPDEKKANIPRLIQEEIGEVAPVDIFVGTSTDGTVGLRLVARSEWAEALLLSLWNNRLFDHALTRDGKGGREPLARAFELRFSPK